jgi:hypothetical protein
MAVSSPRAAASTRHGGVAEAAEPLLQLGRFRASSLTTDRTRATLPRALEIKRAAETPRRFTIVLGSGGCDAAPEEAQVKISACVTVAAAAGAAAAAAGETAAVAQAVTPAPLPSLRALTAALR